MWCHALVVQMVIIGHIVCNLLVASLGNMYQTQVSREKEIYDLNGTIWLNKGLK